MVAATLTLDEAIEMAKRECKDNAAQSYLNALPLAVAEYGTDGFKVQLRYILNNMSGWRGPVARECKAVMKRHSK